MTTIPFITVTDRLLHLSLPGDNIGTSQLVFAGTQGIQEIMLSRNIITGLCKNISSETIVSVFSNLPYLENLDFLSYIPTKCIIQNTSPAYFNLSYNAITFINRNTLSQLRSLSVIDLSYNEIIFLDLYGFSKVHKIIYLNAKGNPIRKFDLDTFLKIDVYVSDNKELCCVLKINQCITND